MRRREFIGCMTLTVIAGRALAQQIAKVYRIAIVFPASIAEWTETSSVSAYRAFLKELRRLGYIEGQNLVVERYTADKPEHYSDLARDVVRSNPDVIHAGPSRLVLVLKAATTTIPIVAATADPIALGMVANLARPGVMSRA